MDPILPLLFMLGSWDSILGTLEVQANPKGTKYPKYRISKIAASGVLLMLGRCLSFGYSDPDP